jgi:hypothetical protein
MDSHIQDYFSIRISLVSADLQLSIARGQEGFKQGTLVLWFQGHTKVNQNIYSLKLPW